MRLAVGLAAPDCIKTDKYLNMHRIYSSMSATKKTSVMVIEHKKETLGEMFDSFKAIFFDPIGLKWISGTILLTVPAFFGEGGALVGVTSALGALAGAGLVAMSIWEKHHLTRRRNEIHDRKIEVLTLAREGKLSQERADWEYNLLDK